MRHSAKCLFILLWAAVSVGCRSGPVSEILELSGVARHGDRLVLVSDEKSGEILSCPLQPSKLQAIQVLELPTLTPRSIEQPLALDLESVGTLGDGQVVVLSERLRSLVDASGVIAQYPEIYGELGNRGLEGLAIRQGAVNWVAVCWEGGFLQDKDLIPQLQDRLRHTALRPVVLIHRLASQARPGRLSEFEAFEVHLPPHKDGYRSRMTDLVWQQFPDGAWGFIGLFSAENPTVSGSARFKYRQLWRLRIDRDSGHIRPVGTPIDLDARIPELANANWEGLCWWEPGRQLILCYDKFPPGKPRIAVLNLAVDDRDWLWQAD